MHLAIKKFILGLSLGLVLLIMWSVFTFYGPSQYWGLWEGWHRWITAIFFPLLYLSASTISSFCPSPLDVLFTTALGIIPYGLLWVVLSYIRMRVKR